MELIKLERRRILSKKVLLIVIFLLVGISAISCFLNLDSYSYLDSNGNKIAGFQAISEEKEQRNEKILLSTSVVEEKVYEYQKLYENKKNLDVNGELKDEIYKKYVKPNNQILELVIRNYCPPYTYDPNILLELNQEQISNFYKIRIQKIKEFLEIDPNLKYTEMERNKLIDKAEKMDVPIELNYAEGWKVISSEFTYIIYFILLIIGIIMVPMFLEDKDVGMKEIILSTEKGRKTIGVARIIAGIQVVTFVYFVGVIIYTSMKFCIFGTGGANSFIQNGAVSWFSLYNITFLQQSICNVLIGYISSLLMMSIIFLITFFVHKVIYGMVSSIGFIILMMSFKSWNVYTLNHYFFNFMPWSLVNYSFMYGTYENYNLGEVMLYKLLFLPLVSFSIMSCLIGVIVLLSKKGR